MIEFRGNRVSITLTDVLFILNQKVDQFTHFNIDFGVWTNFILLLNTINKSNVALKPKIHLEIYFKIKLF